MTSPADTLQAAEDRFIDLVTRLVKDHAELTLELDRLRESNRELVAELVSLVSSAAGYMEYHAEKFYAGLPVPTGLWPAIEHARTVLTKAAAGAVPVGAMEGEGR